MNTPFKRTGRYVFVVMGTTCEYSDRKEWPVACLDTEVRAMDIVKYLDEWAAGMARRMDEDFDWWMEVDPDCGGTDDLGERSTWPDSNLAFRGGGASYYVMKVGCAE